MLMNNKGFSLVEVVATMAILLLVMAAVMSFFMLSQRIYYSGSRQADLHGSVRLAAERVYREVRFANDLVLLEEWNASSADTDNYSYIYHDPETATIMLLDQTGSRPLSNEVVAELLFTVEDSNLLYTIQGERGTTSFVLDSSVKPLNVNAITASGENCVALAFSCPEVGAVPNPGE